METDGCAWTCWEEGTKFRAATRPNRVGRTLAVLLPPFFFCAVPFRRLHLGLVERNQPVLPLGRRQRSVQCRLRRSQRRPVAFGATPGVKNKVRANVFGLRG